MKSVSAHNNREPMRGFLFFDRPERREASGCQRLHGFFFAPALEPEVRTGPQCWNSDGKTFERATRGMDKNPGSLCGSRRILAVAGRFLPCSEVSGVMRSTDGGESWSDCSAATATKGSNSTLFCCIALSPLVAQSRHFATESQCPLLAIKRTLRRPPRMSANDPKSGGYFPS